MPAEHPFSADACCWHAEGWESANEYSVQDARKFTRSEAQARFAREDYTPWVEVGVWKRYVRGFDRQEQYEWWVESRTDGWDEHPNEAPVGWSADPYDEEMPYWQFVGSDHPEAVPVWICGLRELGAPHNPTKAIA